MAPRASCAGSSTPYAWVVLDGKVLLSVLGCPNLPVEPKRPEGERGCLFVALQGKGAVQRSIASGAEERLAVSTNSDCSEILCVESVESGHVQHGHQAGITAALKMRAPPIRMDSQCKFGVVARGEAGLYLRFSARDQCIWDIAAGAMLVEEAGGKVSDAEGKALDFTYGRTINASSLFASNGPVIHEKVLKAIRELKQKEVSSL
eukprot:TRINITY_DN66726_c0_g1_i1.p1 TRINITY_DN66726_c0_g1~~TRINITY_DN66726_c0_g1_i1.p1  ORF type:complete len:205 (-),score=46.94 TRINITY_DN66726_c0_g1_i1:10-624(-)